MIDDTVTTRSVIFGSSKLVSAKWPRWLVPIWLSNPSTVCACGTAMMPALFTSTSAPSIPSAKARTDARSCRSSLRTSTSPVMGAAAWVPLSLLRTAKIVWPPTRANSPAVTNPRPLFAPVTITVRPENEGRSAAGQSVMANTLTARLLRRRVRHRNVESRDDALDVGGLLGSLLGVAGDRELDEVVLAWQGRLARRLGWLPGAGGDDDAVVAVHAAAVEVVAALDHRRRKTVPVVGGGVEPLEVLRQFRVGLAVLDGLAVVEVAGEPQHNRHRRRVRVALGDQLRSRREVRIAVLLPALRTRHRPRQIGELVGGDGQAGDARVLEELRDRHRRPRGGGRRRRARRRPHRVIVRRFRAAARCGDHHQCDGCRAAARPHRISRTAASGRASRVALGGTTNGGSMRIGCSAIASSSSSSSASARFSSSYSDSRLRTAVRTSIPASLISLTSSARDGGVLRYWITVGSMPLSRNKSSVLREVVQRGL